MYSSISYPPFSSLGLNNTSSNIQSTRDNRDDYQSNESEGEQPNNNNAPNNVSNMAAETVLKRNKPPSYPRPHSHLFFHPSTGRMLKGNRHTQRYKNSLYLQTLFPLTEEDLEQDYHRLVPDYQSAFTQVLTNNDKQLLWDSFTNLSEDKQMDMIKLKEFGRKKARSSEKRNPHGQNCYLSKINPDILKSLLRDKRLSEGFMESIEKELYDYFLEDSSSIIIYINLTSYHRMLVHGVCQYNGYNSKTCHIDQDICYIMISCDRLDMPPIPLFKSLQEKHLT